MESLKFSNAVCKIGQKGQLLIELLITIALVSIMVPAMLTGFVSSRGGKAQQNQRLQAVSLLKETEEILRVIREGNWQNIATDGTYHPVLSGSTWTLVSGGETINGFVRQIIISDVFRNSNGTIVSSGGTLDSSSKQVVVTISWSMPLPTSVTATAYFTRYGNASFTQTTVADFSLGTLTNTTVVHSQGTGIPDDGQVQMGSGGGGEWCNPNLSLNPLDLPGQAITTAISASTLASSDFAYTTTGGNSSGDSMDAETISHATPPVAANAGLYNNFKTYGIYVDKNNQYVYLTSDHPHLTVDIVAVGSQPYTETGTYASSGGGTGNSVFVAYNQTLGYDVGYVTAGSALWTFNLSTKTGSRPELGHTNLAGTGKKIIVVGNYAYVAVSSTTEQLDILDISNPTNPTLVSHINVQNGQSGSDIFVNQSGTRAYLVTSQTTPNINDFFIIDTSNKVSTLPPALGAFNTGIMFPTGVTVVPTNRAIIVGSSGQQYQVLDITTESAPTLCGSITNPNGASSINAISSVLRSDNSAFSYILTNNANAEFQMISGTGGMFSSGTFISAPFTASASSAFNSFTATVTQPLQTTISLQVASAQPVNGSCSQAVFTYVGPDGNTNTFYSPSSNTISGQIPLAGSGTYQNPAQCFSYKVYFTNTDFTRSAVFYDMTVNYSP